MNSMSDSNGSTADGTTGFADRMKLLIKACGSVTSIARACGFSEGVVRSWRDGRSDPSRERCLKLARQLGVSLVWLMAGEGAMWDTESSALAPRVPTANRVDAAPLPSTDMDPRRLTAAMRALSSALELAGGDGSALDQHADLLAGFYAMTGETDPLARAERTTALHRELARRMHPGARRIDVA